MRFGDTRELVDIGIGITGFFAVVFLIITVVTELTGGDALGWALTLLVLILILGLLWRTRRRFQAAEQPEDPETPSNHP